MHVFLTKLRLLLLPFQLFHEAETYQYEFVKRWSNKINVTGGNVLKLDKLVIGAPASLTYSRRSVALRALAVKIRGPFAHNVNGVIFLVVLSFGL